MVQMKANGRLKGRGLRDRLYIPHGSDESVTLTYPSNFVSDFISHMVQMKVAAMQNGLKEPVNFISHMVQMKDV